MVTNPYQPPDAIKQDSSADETRCELDSLIVRDRGLLAVIIAFGLFAICVFPLREAIELHFCSIETAYSTVGQGFIASVVGVLVMFRSKKSRN